MNVHERKLYYLKTKIKVYCLPHQENVVSQLTKNFWHMQKLGVATWNSEKQLGRCFILSNVPKHTCNRQVFIRTVKCGAIGVNTARPGLALLCKEGQWPWCPTLLMSSSLLPWLSAAPSPASFLALTPSSDDSGFTMSTP